MRKGNTASSNPRTSNRLQKKAKASNLVIDEHTRKEVQSARLLALEDENFASESHMQASDCAYVDEEEDEVLDGEKKQKRRKVSATVEKGSKFKSFDQLVLEENYSSYPSHVPTYVRATAARSRYPERRFCSVCGYKAAYTCVRCGMRFCSLRCNQTHIETRCLKFTA